VKKIKFSISIQSISIYILWFKSILDYSFLFGFLFVSFFGDGEHEELGSSAQIMFKWILALNLGCLGPEQKIFSYKSQWDARPVFSKPPTFKYIWKKNCRGNNSQQKSKNINYDLLDYLGLIKLCSKLGSRSKACIIFQIITLNDTL